MMSKPGLTFGVFVLSCMAVPALAQMPPYQPSWIGTPEPCLPFEPQNSIEWPDDAAFGDPQNFGRTVIADLDGDLDPEAVVLADGVAVVLWNVAVYDAPQQITFPNDDPATDVTDLATLPGLGPDGRDAIAMSDGRGLFLVTYVNGEFPDPLVIDPTWTNLKKLHAENLDGDDDLDLLAISSDKRSILSCFIADPVFTTETTETVELDMLDVESMDWNGNGVRDIVALTRRGILIFLPGGYQTIPYLSVTGSITRFSSADVGERLAWTRRKTPSQSASELVVVAQGVMEGPYDLEFDLECGQDPTFIEPIAVLAGDYDDDANEELLLVHETNQTAVMLENLGGSVQHFQPSDAYAHDVIALADPVSGAGNVGVPAFANLDCETPDDIVFPVGSTETVEVFLDLPCHRTGLPLIGGTPPSAEILMHHTEYGPGNGPAGGELRLAFHVKPRYDDHTHVEVAIWFQQNTEADTIEMAVDFFRFPLDIQANGEAYPYQYVPIRLQPDPNIGLPVGFPNDPCWLEPKPYFFVELRYLRIVGSETVEHSRVFPGGFSLVTCNGTNDWSHLTDAGLTGPLFGLYEHTIIPDPTSRQLLGAFVPMDGVPYFGPGADPDRPGVIPGTQATHYNPQP